MAAIRKPYFEPITDLRVDQQSQATLNTELASNQQALCDARPRIKWDGVMESNCQADLQTNWKVTGEAGLKADPEISASPRPPTARIPSGVKMLRARDVIERRGKKRSAHYKDIQTGLFIEPVAIGVRARATPEHEVDTLIAASIAGKRDDEIRALVIKLRAARKGAL